MEALTPGTVDPSNYSMEVVPARRGSGREKTSLEAENKQVVERIWSELVNGGRLDSLRELVSPGFVDRAPLPETPSDIGGLRQRLRLLHQAFPDFHSTIMQLIAEGDKVVAFVESSGTHQGTFLGLPATGRRFTIQEIQILRILDGQMIEHWQVADHFGMFVQLGFAGPPPVVAG